MAFIQENTIHIDFGLSKTYTLIQFTDVHVVTYDLTSDDHQTIEKAKENERIWMQLRLDFAKKYNDTYDSNNLLSSKDCLKHLIDYTNSSSPDLVLLTGDIIDYYSPSNYDYLRKSVKNLSSPYVFSCGNHETPSEHFESICKENCDYSQFEFDDFMVISLNNSNRKIKSSQLNNLKMTLGKEKPILLAMHIPIMTSYNQHEFSQLDDYFSMKYNDCDAVTTEFIQLVSTSNLIKAVFCGHIHGSLISKIAPHKHQYCCSSGLIGHVNKIIIK